MFKKQNKKLFFQMNRMVYEGGENPGQVVAEQAAKDIQKVPQDIEKDLTNEDMQLSVQSAIDAATRKIDTMTTTAVEKIAPTEEALKSDENQPYLQKVGEARDAAKAQIEANKDLYQKISDYVSKASVIKATLVTNDTALSTISGDKLSDLDALNKTIDGLHASLGDVNGLDVAGTGMEADKTALTQKINDQVAVMQGKATEIMLNTQDKVNSYSDLIVRVGEASNNGGVPRIKDFGALMNARVALEDMGKELAKYPDQTQLSQLVQGQIDAAVTVLDQANANLTAKDPKFGKEMNEYVALTRNLDSAKANLDKVKTHPDPDPEKQKKALSDANGWIRGATTTLETKRVALVDTGRAIDKAAYPDQQEPEANPKAPVDVASNDVVKLPDVEIKSTGESPKYNNSTFLAELLPQEKTTLQGLRDAWQKTPNQESWNKYQTQIASIATEHGFTEVPQAPMPSQAIASNNKKPLDASDLPANGPDKKKEA